MLTYQKEINILYAIHRNLKGGFERTKQESSLTAISSCKRARPIENIVPVFAAQGFPVLEEWVSKDRGGKFLTTCRLATEE